MVITPSSDVILLKCPLELSQDNQINFASKTAQYNYFNGLSKKTLSNNDFTYVRKDSVIRANGVYDEFVEYNYVMYRNDEYSNKWFYAFIDKIEYINDNTTYIYILTDTFQTWQFDLSYKKTFVEREHVNDDTIGKHTLPEGLDVGEYEIVDLKDIPMSTNREWVPAFCVSALPEGCSGAVDGRVKGDNGLIGGVFNSLKFFSTHTLGAAKAVIGEYEDGSVNTDAIVNVYMVPQECVDTTVQNPTHIEYNNLPIYPLLNYYNTEDAYLMQSIYLAEGYLPVNKKLYTAPFSYIYMSNNAGEDITLKWEDFPIETHGSGSSASTMPTMTYYKYYVPSSGLSAKLIFSKYKSYTSDNTTATQMSNYGINFAKVPVCAWTTDYYTNWLTQNGINTQVSIVNAAASVVGGTIMGSAIGGGIGVATMAGSLISGFSQVNNAMAQQESAKAVPPQSHGDISTGDMTYALKRNSISCYFMSVRPEVARCIDSYFSMYGYKVNSVKVPNITGRQNWNYVKTINCYIQADIPQEDLQTIKNMFDKGLTIWHNPATFMDYSQSNAIVS